MDPLTPQENKPDSDKKIDAPAQSGAGHVDLSKILLPKKEVPGQTPLSAQRVNAGALLEQEITAGTLGSDTEQMHAAETAQAKAAAAAAPTPAPEETLVKPLETFQRDIESVVQHDNVSVLSIATAEAERRSGTGTQDPAVKKESRRSMLTNVAMIGGGLVFLVGASGALAYLATRQATVPIAADTAPTTPVISVDAVKEVTITPDEPRQQVMANLNAARQATSLSLGLMSQLLVTESSTTPTGAVVTPLTAQDFLTLVAPSVPAALARNLKPDYLLGVHVYNYNQAFIIANVYSYEAAYSGMLQWEKYMQQDLSPLFDYMPSPRIQTQTFSSTTPNPTDQFSQTGFVDKIVENHDSRALVNANGDIYLLWTFLDRNTLVITTNDATLREIITRLKVAPITPVPGQ